VPPVEAADLFQDCIVWRKIDETDDNEPVVSPGEQVDCRWVNRRIQTVGADGEPVAYDATLALDEDVPDGSIVWEGCLADFEDDIAKKNRLMAVIRFAGTPDVKGRNTRYEYGLMRFRGVLPTIRQRDGDEI
jgi:hypothetical protein